MLDHHLAAGALGGVATAALLHPIDLVKVRLQVQDGSPASTQYRGLVGAVRAIAAAEGAPGFYRGLVPAMVGSGASWGLYFFFYEACKRRMLQRDAAAAAAADTLGASGPGRPHRGESPPRLSMLQNMYASWESGTITCLFTNPIWLVKTRLQLQRDAPGGGGGGGGTGAGAGAAPYRGMTHALRTIARDEGLAGLYRGLLPALLLVSHGMVQFAVYEELKARLAAAGAAAAAGDGGGGGGGGGISSGALFAAGAASKAVATTATYPYQVIKARLQQRRVVVAAVPPAPQGGGGGGGGAPLPPPSPSYTGFARTVATMWAREGPAGFYRGFGANLLRVAPQSAVTLAAYEHALRVLGALEAAAAGGRV